MAGNIYRSLRRNQDALSQLAGLAETIVRPMQQKSIYETLLGILSTEEPVMGAQVQTTRPEGSIGPEGVMGALSGEARPVTGGPSPTTGAVSASREVRPNPATITPVQTGTRTRVRSMDELGNEDIFRLGASMSAGPAQVLEMLAGAAAARRPKVQVVNQEGGGLDVVRIKPTGEVESERLREPQFRPPTPSYTKQAKRDASGKVMTETVGDKTYEVEEEIDRTSGKSTGRTSLGKEVSSSGEDKVATRQREQKISTLETKKRGLEAKIMARHGGKINLDKILSNEQAIPKTPKYDSYGDEIPNAFIEDKDVAEWVKTARELESVFEQTGKPFERRVGVTGSKGSGF